MRFYPLLRWLYMVNFLLFAVLTTVHLALRASHRFHPAVLAAEAALAMYFLWGHFTIYWELTPVALESHYLWMHKSISYKRITAVQPARRWYTLGADAVQVLTKFSDGLIIRTDAQEKFLIELRHRAPHALYQI